MSVDKSKPLNGGESTAEMQKDNANVSAVMALITKLQKENKQLQKEKDELQVNITSMMKAKGTVLFKMAHHFPTDMLTKSLTHFLPSFIIVSLLHSKIF